MDLMLLCLGLFAVALVVLLVVAGSQSGNKGEAEPEVVPKMKRSSAIAVGGYSVPSVVERSVVSRR